MAASDVADAVRDALDELAAIDERYQRGLRTVLSASAARMRESLRTLETGAYVVELEMARSSNKRVIVTARTDTQALDPRYPTGVPPIAVPVIVVAAPPALNLTVGTPFSVNWPSYVTGADAPPNSYTLSGSIPGLSFNTTSGVLSGTPTTAGAYSVTLGAIDTAYPFSAPVATLATVAVAPSAAITVPKFLTATVTSGPDRITVKCDYPRSGVVILEKQIDGGAWAQIDTQSVTATALDFTGSAIGSATLASFAVNGGGFTISNVIDGGYGNAIDNVNFYGAPVTFPVGARFGGTIQPFISANDYSEAGLMVRQSRTALAPSLAIRRRANIGFAPLLSRATQGATLTYKADAIVSGAVDFRIVRESANNWRLDQYDASGAALNITTHTVVMSGPVEAGVELDNNGVGAAISATFGDMYLSSEYSYADEAVSSGHVYKYRVKSTGSEYSNEITSAIDIAPSSVMKFRPGNIAWYLPPANAAGNSGYRFDLVEHRNAILAFLETIKNESSVRGIKVAGYPAAFEGNTAGDYSAGFASLDIIANKCHDYGKTLHVRYEFGKFGNQASILHIYPAYQVNAGGPGVNPNGLGYSNLVSLQNGVYKGVTSRAWNAAGMDRIIAMSAAYGARYNSHPAFEELTLCGETSISVQNGVDGFSNTKLLNEYLRLMPLARSHWPNTALRIGANDMGNEANLAALYAGAAASYILFGGPDIWPGDVTSADRVFTGRAYGSSAQVTEDWRGKLGWSVECQDQSFGVFSLDRWPPATLWSSQVNGYVGVDDGQTQLPLNPLYISWYVNEYAGSAIHKWSTGTLPYLRSINGSLSSNYGPLTQIQKPTLYP